MRVLTLSTHDTRCGIATYNDSLTSALRARGATVEVYPIDDGYLKAESEKEMETFISRFIEKAGGFDAVIVQHEHAILHGRHPHKVGQCMLSILLDGIAVIKKPSLIIFHSKPIPVSPKRILSRKRIVEALIKWRINRNPRLLVAVHGREGKGKFIDYGLKERKVWEIEHPFPDADPLPMDTENREIVTLTIFGFVSEYKGYAEALAALAELPPNFHLCVAGGLHPNDPGNPIYEQLVNHQHQGPLAGRISVTGWLSDADLREVMKKTSIVLACYDTSGPLASGAVTWSVGFGRPVIASDTVTFRRIQEESRCFELVPPNQPEALRKAILRLAADEPLRQTLIENGLSHAARHSWNNLADKILKNLESLNA